MIYVHVYPQYRPIAWYRKIEFLCVLTITVTVVVLNMWKKKVVDPELKKKKGIKYLSPKMSCL